MRNRWIFSALGVSVFIAWSWDKYDNVSLFFHKYLDPALLPLFNWNTFYAMVFLVMLVSIVMTFVQKYGTNQDEIRVMKKRQKELQKEMKKYQAHPEKIAELSKEQFEFMGKMMKASMGTIVYTAIPIILLIRWLGDYFSAFEDTVKFFGMTWFWFYMVCSMFFSIVFRKILKVD